MLRRTFLLVVAGAISALAIHDSAGQVIKDSSGHVITSAV